MDSEFIRASDQRINVHYVHAMFWGYVACYTGPLTAFLEASILPAEFFTFGKLKKRNIGKQRFEKVTGKVFPPDVIRAAAHLSANGMVDVWLYVERDPTEPVFIPAGDTWPDILDSRFHPLNRYEGNPAKPTATIINFADFKKPHRPAPEPIPADAASRLDRLRACRRPAPEPIPAVSSANMHTIKDRLMAIECLFLGMGEMLDRGTIDDPDIEVLRAIAQRGRHLEGEAMEALPNGGDL